MMKTFLHWTVDTTSPIGLTMLIFMNLLNSKGLLHSDQQLSSGSSADSPWSLYGKNVETLYNDFASAMLKMSNHRLPTGTQVQIRTNCRKVI
ncbi:Cationic peroxidase 1 [Morus notabilis]|uniref:peroxidase n=1 Tax=Morus notabilis TaxID=981085 RepID=W9QCP1_9ROSA|nr:Cationic peroxidase 1 [Morus notabilis]